MPFTLARSPARSAPGGGTRILVPGREQALEALQLDQVPGFRPMVAASPCLERCRRCRPVARPGERFCAVELELALAAMARREPHEPVRLDELGTDLVA